MKHEESEYADILFFAQHAHAVIEDELQELFDGPWETYKAKNYDLTFHQIGYDDYDQSIEVYLRADAVVDKEKFLAMIRKFGFDHGWLNFDDGTEIYLLHGHFGERVKKDHPHWTKEMAEDKEVLGQLDEFRARPVLRRMFKK